MRCDSLAGQINPFEDNNMTNKINGKIQPLNPGLLKKNGVRVRQYMPGRIAGSSDGLPSEQTKIGLDAESDGGSCRRHPG